MKRECHGTDPGDYDEHPPVPEAKHRRKWDGRWIWLCDRCVLEADTIIAECRAERRRKVKP